MISWIIFAIVTVCVLLYCKFGRTIGYIPDFRKPFSVIGLVVYAIIMLLCCSCGSHKSNMKQETSIDTESAHQRKDTASFSEHVKKTEHEDVTETIEETTTVYDTSQPVDSGTGKHPVKSETKKTTKRDTNKGSQEDKNTSLNQSVSLNGQDKTAIKATGEEDKRKDETTVPRQIGGIIWALVGLVIVVVAGWAIYKSKSKSKK